MVRLGVAVLALLLVAGVARAEDATVELLADPPGREVPALLFGTNLQWEHSGDGALVETAPGQYGWRAGLFERIAEAGIGLVRFPGGSLANTYRWADAIGPLAGRRRGLSYDGTPVASVFGSDELITLAQRARVPALITVNVAAGEAEAADWVDYLNAGPGTAAGEARRRNGAAAPLGVHYWEIGNELFSPREHGTLPAGDYGRKVVSFAAAMRARDPSIAVGAMLEGSFQKADWMRGVMPHLLSWNDEVLRVAGPAVDFVALHFGAPYDTLWRENNLHELVWAAPLVFEATVADVKAMLRRYARPGVPILLTEYTTFFGGSGPPGARIAGPENALFAALMLFSAMRDPDIAAAANWSLLNNSSFGLLRSEGAGAVTPRPTFAIVRALSGFAGRRLRALRIAAPGYDVDAKGNVPALHNVPWVDGVAVSSGPDQVALALVNRSARNDVRIRLSAAGRQVRIGKGELLQPGGTDWRQSVLGDGEPMVQLPPGAFVTLSLDLR